MVRSLGLIMVILIVYDSKCFKFSIFGVYYSLEFHDHHRQSSVAPH
jgi:hypothetical protein